MTLLQQHYAQLRGRRAWIIGGRRIGVTVARALAEQGVHLAINYRHSRREAEETAAMARGLGVEAMTIQCDAANRNSVTAAVQKLRRQWHGLDILIPMASVFDKISMDRIDPQDWEANVSAHVLGSFWPVQMSLPMLHRGSHIICVADRTSIGPVFPDYLPYVVTKGAVEHLTRALAKELAPRGIIVNALAPGPILPPDELSPKTVAAMRARSPLKIPVNSEQTVAEFALLVLYLSVTKLASGFTYPLDQGQNL